jgi:hypothetical protein
MATVLLRTLGKHLLTCIVLQRLLYNTVTLGLYNEIEKIVTKITVIH